MDDYSDIINLPHYVSKKHPQMSLHQRSAQFAPFAALTGYDGQIRETARLTRERIEIDEEVKEELDRRIAIIKENIKLMPSVSFTYFVPDRRKDGGDYIRIRGNVKKIDEYNELIILENNQTIPISEIIGIESDLIKE